MKGSIEDFEMFDKLSINSKLNVIYKELLILKQLTENVK